MAALGATPGADAGAPAPGPTPRNVVVVGAHPDDPETGVGGTAKRLADLGHRVTFLYLTKGEAGIPGVAPLVAGRRREEEALAACKVLGTTAVFAGQIDAATHSDDAARQDFRLKLESLHPDLVFAHWPLDIMRDHRVSAELVLDIWSHRRGAFSLLFFEVLSGFQTQTFSPDVYVDITSVLEAKRLSVFAHASQDPGGQWEHHQVMHRMRGLETLTAAAEAFVHHRASPTTDLLVGLAPRPR
jgi:LmbE family N-acetylglucosaminyl deacetylase